MKTGKGWFIAAGVSLVLAAVARFCLVGYRFSALLLCLLAAVLVFYGVTARRGTKAAGVLRILAAAGLAAGFVLFLITEIPVWRDSRSDEDTDAPYIIVMGAAVHGGTPSLSMVERTTAAFHWLTEHPEGIAVVSGGQGAGEDMSEAEAMYDLLTAWGIAPERVLMETLSTSSYENLLFSLRVIADHGGDPGGRIAICSSEYHLCRLSLMSRELGFEPVRVAARTGHISLRVNYAVREAFALWKCRLFGIE